MNPNTSRLWLWFMDAGARVGCHQMPERSFFYRGYQYPVCARCTGVALGSVLALCLLALHTPLWMCIVSCAVMLLDWSLQAAHIRESTNVRRLITGMLGGYGLMSLQILIIVSLIQWIINHVVT